MPSHIRIGAIFAQAWGLFRRRFILLPLLALLQAASVVVGVTWHDLYFTFGLYEYLPAFSDFASWPPYATEVMLAGGLVVFVFVTTIMVMLVRQQAGHQATPFWQTIARRFVPALVATALCFGVIGLLLYFWFELTLEMISSPYSQLVVIGVALAMVLLLVAFASLVFVTLPVATLETGGPLRAIRRSLALGSGQRWRLAAINLILLLGLALGLVLCAVLMDPLMLSIAGVSTGEYLVATVGALLTIFFLALTLIIASAYQQMVRLRDGVSAEEVGLVFE